MKKHSLISILLVLSVGFISVNAEAAFTVATFDDPAIEGTTPLFTVDYTNHLITGGWANGNLGLTLQIPYSNHNFENAWFKMDEVTVAPYTDLYGEVYGVTGGGEINFYAHGTTTNPLLTINFESGYVDYHNFGADEFFGENVTISGFGITPGSLSEEEFSFSFSNQTVLPGSDDGFTATAAFTSSVVPEPTMICLLSFGALVFPGRRRA